LRPASDNAQFMRPVMANRFTTPDVHSLSLRVCFETSIFGLSLLKKILSKNSVVAGKDSFSSFESEDLSLNQVQLEKGMLNLFRKAMLYMQS